MHSFSINRLHESVVTLLIAGVFSLGAALGALAQRQDYEKDPTITSLVKEIRQRQGTGRDKEAEALVWQLTDYVKGAYGEESLAMALALEWQTNTLADQQLYAESITAGREALRLRRKLLPPDSAALLAPLNNLASVLLDLQNGTEAIPLYVEALALSERVYGPEHPVTASQLVALAKVQLGYDADPQKFGNYYASLTRALEIFQRINGPESGAVVDTLLSMAAVHRAWVNFEEAERVSETAFAISTRRRYTTKAMLALTSLIEVFLSSGRYKDAVVASEKLVPLAEKLKRDNPRLEPLASMTLAEALGNLGTSYLNIGRYEDALALQKRVIVMLESAAGKESHLLRLYMHNLGRAYLALGQLSDAADAFDREIYLLNKGGESSTTVHAHALAFRAKVASFQGDYGNATKLAEKALAGFEAKFPEDNETTAFAIMTLGDILARQKRHADAKPVFARARNALDKNVGPGNPRTAEALKLLAASECALGEHSAALDHARQSADIFTRRAETGASAAYSSRQEADSEGTYAALVCAAFGSAKADAGQRNALLDEALLAAQREDTATAADALNSMAVRASAADAGLANAVRQQQDLSAKLQSLELELIAALSSPKIEQGKLERLRKQRADAEKSLAAATAALEKAYPDFAALTNPKPIGVEEVRASLKDDEALVAFLVTAEATYVWAVTKDKLGWERIALGEADIGTQVAGLRDTIDLSKFDPNGTLLDVAAAHALYASLLGPVESVIKDKPHLLVAASGALTALPFHVLVTEKPASAATKPEDFRDVAFLLKRHAVTTLPSVASLKALRAIAVAASGDKPLVGYGDPVFSRGAPARDRGKSKKKDATVEVAAVRTGGPPRAIRSVSRGYASFFRGAETDLEALSQGLAPLPETATELKAVAAKLGVPESEIHLGQNANEPAVRKAKLDGYRIVYFATHGLVAGDVKGLAEPALVLTLPNKATDADDGLLTSSEVANLKLNAEWVVLSACNTAAGDKPGAEALSGLARAFFYAGARALLVSHWPVGSAAAEKLTTATFEALQKEPGLGRSEALRRAMRALMADTSDPWNAYPALWAPFVVVGEGG